MLSFLDQSSVPLRKVFWVGTVMAIFNPPVVGLVFALLFAFKKETRRVALIVAIWSIIWAIIFAYIIGLLALHGDIHINSTILR